MGGQHWAAAAAGAIIDLLPAIADAVGGQVPVLLDSGIRRSTDVIKAGALDATAVAVALKCCGLRI